MFLEREDTRYLYEARGQQATSLALTPERWATITRINAAVNARGTYVSDPGEGDRILGDRHQTLAANDWKGDCEDFALQKQKDLIEAGFPPESVLLAYTDSDNSLLAIPKTHAVLIVRTNLGDFVLDNDVGASEVMHWQDNPRNRILSIQSEEKPEIMHRVVHTTSYVTQSAQGTGVSQIHLQQKEDSDSIYINGNMPAGQTFSVGPLACTSSRPLFYKAQSHVRWPHDQRYSEVVLSVAGSGGKEERIDLYAERNGYNGKSAVLNDTFKLLGEAERSPDGTITVTPATDVSAAAILNEFTAIRDKLISLGVSCNGSTTPEITADGVQVIAKLNVHSIGIGLGSYASAMVNEPDSTVAFSVTKSLDVIPELPEALPAPRTPPKAINPEQTPSAQH